MRWIALASVAVVGCVNPIVNPAGATVQAVHVAGECASLCEVPDAGDLTTIRRADSQTLRAQALFAAERDDCTCAFVFANAFATKEPARRRTIVEDPRFAACSAPARRHEIAEDTAREASIHRCREYVAGDGREEMAANLASEAQRERENAEIRATGARLQRERDAARSTEPRQALGPVDDSVPDHLDRDAISNAIAGATPEIRSCRDRSAVKGEVLASVKVAAGGSVVAVAIQSTPDSVLGACVAAALQKVTFAKTRTGGAFRYPFVF